YESKGKQWAKSKPSLPIGLDPSYAIPSTMRSGAKKIPGLTDTITVNPPQNLQKEEEKG
ncbi:hypothetical protein TNCT_97291, partial [Trichonephila clavata]